MTDNIGDPIWEQVAKAWEEKKSEERDKHILFAISRFQRDLRLGDWDIRYDPEWEPGDDSATVHTHRCSRAATIRLDPEVTGDNIDSHIAHELTHLVLQDFSVAAMNAVAGAGPGAERLLDTLSDMEEVICEKIAHALTGVIFEPVGEANKKALSPFTPGYSARQNAGDVLHTMQGEA